VTTGCSWLAVPLMAIALLAGCGDDDSNGSGSAASGVGADFAAQAVAVCDKAKELKEGLGPFPYQDFNPTDPNVSQFSAVASYLQKLAGVWQQWLSDLQGLGAPPSGTDAWDDLLAAIEEQGRLNEEQIAAALSGDQTGFTDDYYQGQDTQRDLRNAAEAAGVPGCAVSLDAE
jgi:hypothetical protein